MDSLKLRYTEYLGSSGMEYIPEELVMASPNTVPPENRVAATTQIPDMGLPALSVITPLMVGS